MAKKKYFTDESLSTLVSEIMEYTDEAASTKVDKVTGKGLSTNDYTSAEKTKLSGIETGAQVNTITGVKGDSESSYRTGNINITKANIGLGNVDNTADSAKRVSYAESAGSATSATSAGSATKATQDASGNVITSTYETKTDASAKLASANKYTDDKIALVMNNSSTAVDSVMELAAAMEENADAIEALEAIASGKADASHSHAISDVSGLQSALDGKAASSHGTHVSYSTTAPVMDGTASVGTASTVARSDHKHPTDTSRASKTEFDTHTSNTTVHVTSTERANWNAAKTHADSAHAPSNAQPNQNAFSNIKVGSTTIAADSTTDTLELVGSNVTITPDATNDKVTISVADGSTSAKGIVQLTNSTSSTSTTTAATPSSVKSAYDRAGTAITNAANAQTRADAAYTLADGKVDSLSDLGITATATELNYMDGVTSNVQTQLDGKSDSGHTHNYAGSSSAGGAATSANKVNKSLTVQLNGGSTEGTNKFTFDGSAAKSLNITASSVGAAASSHTHDDRYYTETEIDTKVSTLNTAINGKAASSHTHAISDVTNLQSSLDAKQATISGGASTITSSNLTASRALVSDGNGKVAVSAVTSTELGYLDGVTSAIQTQLNGKLEKTTYEYNKELALGSTGKVCIGKFPMYDSNISVEIKSTTSTTYNGTLVIATQNINTTGGGVYKVTVYGDADNSLTNSIKIHYGSGSNVFSVYIDLPSWSKNLLHIQCVSLAGTPTDIATTVSAIPSNATIVPTNALKAQLDGKAAITIREW